MNLTRGINLRKIAEQMPGASGAEVKVGVHVSVCAFVCVFACDTSPCRVTSRVCAQRRGCML